MASMRFSRRWYASISAANANLERDNMDLTGFKEIESKILEEFYQHLCVVDNATDFEKIGFPQFCAMFEESLKKVLSSEGGNKLIFTLITGMR